MMMTMMLTILFHSDSAQAFTSLSLSSLSLSSRWIPTTQTPVLPLAASCRPWQSLVSLPSRRSARFLERSNDNNDDNDNDNNDNDNNKNNHQVSSTHTSTGTGTATIPQEIFNLVKSIVGAGVLTLPAGIAAFGNAPSAVLPATLLIALIGSLSAYGFCLIGRVCALTQTTSYRDAWTRTVSASSSWIPAWSVTLKTICATLAYSMILADTFTALAQSAGIMGATKSATLVVITTTLLLPLCLMKNLSSLAPFSLLGSLGMIYTAVAMTIRYVTNAYVPGVGTLVTHLAPALRPRFGTLGAKAALSPSVTILLGMLSTAYMAHFNAPKFYTELKQNTVPRYATVVSASFGISILVFAVMASMGFLTFGAASAGLILNNYSTHDVLMGWSRLAVAISIVFSYPLAFVGARDGILDLLQVKDRSAKLLNSLTVALLSSLTVAALIVPDVSFVLALAGATLGNALIYIFPGIMWRGAVKRSTTATASQKREVKLAMGSAVFGLVMGALGAVKAIQSVL